MYIAQHDEGFIGCMRVKVYPQTRHISYTSFVLPAIFLCDPSHASEVVMGNVFAKLFPRADTLIVTDRIGKGGYGEVFRGTLGSRPVAVKKIYDILIEAARENEETLERMIGEFRRECDLLKAAKHPNVVEFIGVFNQGEGEESALLIMELMEQTLEQFLRDSRGTLLREQQIAICLQVVSGLLFLHQHDPQILHRDLTAKNVLMNKDGSFAKISDFGQAKFRPTSVQYLTTRQPGTILYMPPEALVDKPRFTDKGDIFSLGVLMLQVATQEPPSCGLVIVKGQPEVERRAADLSRLPADHPLRPLILQCLQNDPAKRPSCSEVLHYLLFGPHVDIPSVSVALPLKFAWHMSVFALVHAEFKTLMFTYYKLHNQ